MSEERVRRLRVLIGEQARAAVDDDLPLAMVEHALDPRERVRWERGAHGLVVIRVPSRAAHDAVALETVPVAIVLGATYGSVVSASENDTIQRVRDAKGPPLVSTLHAAAESFEETIDAIERAIDAVEERLARSLRNTEVLELLRYQKALVHHTAALRALVAMLDRLPAALDLDPEDAQRLADVAVELRQALEVADLERATLSDTMDAFASIVSNNLNDVMRVLAGVAVVLTPPVVVASLWGMNVQLPLSRHAAGFWWLVGLSTATSVAVWWVLRRSRWL